MIGPAWALNPDSPIAVARQRVLRRYQQRHRGRLCNVACGSGIVTVNSPSGSTLQCDTWLWDDMPLNSPGGSTLQCGRWIWDDMPLNSPKRPPYWNSTSGFDFDHITAVDMSFCTSLRNFIQIGPPSAEKCRHVYFQDGGSQLSWILWIQ